MRLRSSLVCMATLVLAVGIPQVVGCGSENGAPGIFADDGGLDGTADGATVGDGSATDDGQTLNPVDGGLCSGVGVTCTANAECCSSTCDPTAKKCVAGVGPGNCKSGGASCTSSTECCNLTCVSGTCGATACTADTQPCTTGASCCGGVCTNGTCTALNTTCKTSGNTCAQSGDCCSKLCQGGHCQIAASFCVQTGDVCSDANQCCGGVCTKAAGAALGVCGVPPSGGTNCSGGIGGTVCNGCTDCCSRLCAPFLSGVKVCQPANGCHIEGDLCLKDTDCCGGDNTTGLPGNGNVTCEIAAGYTIGICRSPKSGTDAGTGACNPEGNVCHFKDYVCGASSSAQNNCCLHLGSKTNCDLDPLGIPRCHAVGADGDAGIACRGGGEACAYTADCCNGAPCVPGAGGKLTCYAGPSGGGGGAICVPTTGPCTVNADCCTGSFCSVAVGSVQGTCNAVPGGGGGGGADGGGADGGTSGTDGGSGGGTSACSLYGQSCTSAANCCNSVACTAADGFSLCNSSTGCTCVYAAPR